MGGTDGNIGGEGVSFMELVAIPIARFCHFNIGWPIFIETYCNGYWKTSLIGAYKIRDVNK